MKAPKNYEEKMNLKIYLLNLRACEISFNKLDENHEKIIKIEKKIKEIDLLKFQNWPNKVTKQ